MHWLWSVLSLIIRSATDSSDTSQLNEHAGIPFSRGKLPPDADAKTQEEHGLDLIGRRGGPSVDDEAETLLRTAVNKDPSLGKAWYGLAVLAKRRHDIIGALKNYRTSVAVDPRSARAHMNLGILLSRENGMAEAAESLFQAAALSPSLPAAQVWAADAAAGTGKLKFAEEGYTQAIALDPTYVGAFLGLGLLQGRHSRHSEAEASLAIAVKLAPARADMHLNLGAALSNQGSFEAAARKFAVAFTLQPQNRDAYVEHAQALRRLRRHAEAVESYKESLKLHLGDVSVWEGLAEALSIEGRLDEAAFSFASAASLNLHAYRPHLRLGHMLLAQGKNDEALQSFRQAAEINLEGFQAHLLLGLMLELQGDIKAARVSYKTGLQTCPSSVRAETLRMIGQSAMDIDLEMGFALQLPYQIAGTCDAGDRTCWDLMQRLQAAKWQDVNSCENPEDKVLAEPCEIFEMRRWFIQARINAAQKSLILGSEHYPWEWCYVYPREQSFFNIDTAELSTLPSLNDLSVTLGEEREGAIEARELLKQWGVVRLLHGDANVSSDGLQAVKDDADLIEYLLRRAAEADSSTTQYVHRARHRHHLRLRPDEAEIVGRALGRLAKRIEYALPFGAGEGLVIEMGAFITNQGANPQRWHEDFMHPGCRYCADACAATDNTTCSSCLTRVASASPGERVMPVYSCQWFLTEELGGSDTGGLEVKPGTHELGPLHARSNVTLLSQEAKPTSPIVNLKGPPGTVVCYDGTLQHRGAGHTATQSTTRLVLYISLAGPGMPVLPGTAMAPDLIGLRVAELVAFGRVDYNGMDVPSDHDIEL